MGDLVCIADLGTTVEGGVCAEVPVLLASGYDVLDANPELLELPGVGSIHKPLRMPALVDRLQELLGE